MSKIAVVYWSGTGNTEMMANEVSNGAQGAGAQVDVFTAADFTPEHMDKYDAVAFGCPSMGAEVLEEEEFGPMFQGCKPKLKDKKIALFGSYGWGHGEWMEDWQQTCNECGAILTHDFVICMDAPDDDAKAACSALGKSLV